MTLHPFQSSISHSCYSSRVLSFFFFSPASKPLRPCWPRMDSAAANKTIATARRQRKKEKIVVVLGATGAGKTRLSVELATRFQAEIVNSDKMQVYKGLDITTNKIPPHERRGIAHHLMGEFDPVDGEFTPAEFRHLAGSVISDIASRKKLPLVVGGSNSFVHALVVDRFNPQIDIFDGSHSLSSELRYNCCFLWVDVSFTVLSEYLSKRVDEMLDSGMFQELAEFYNPTESADSAGPRTGLRKAIGVPEFDCYFKKHPPDQSVDGADHGQTAAYEEAVREIKENTCQLAKRQIGKIVGLRGGGWDLRRLDATEPFRAAMKPEGCGKRWSEIWQREVLEPSVKIVKHFLEE
ncbi:adenylate isopentenyltransferase-like isoform X1 [Juglans regia]|uniref:Adenylate isopentenyltransferase-like isoform X1 n=1 Tax=Juglans regia TaxID=51240 RepID=A0A2I4DWG2_JUGRE|nr:adenylate isopentenyltransferase-like isoform X2 [Juglans regia]XP_018811489.1 adenylate isopentenyltransferase-like isoform X1 [Juglans regia]